MRHYIWILETKDDIEIARGDTEEEAKARIEAANKLHDEVYLGWYRMELISRRRVA